MSYINFAPIGVPTDGQIPYYHAATKTIRWTDQTPADEPIANVFWVSIDAVAGGNGSAQAPFDTLAAAIAAVAATDDLTGVILVAPGDYTGEGSLTIGGLTLAMWAWGVGSANGQPALGPSVFIDTFTATLSQGSFYFNGLDISQFDMGDSQCQTDMTSIHAASGSVASVLGMRGTANRGAVGQMPSYTGGTGGNVACFGMRVSGVIVAAQLFCDTCTIDDGAALQATDFCEFRTTEWLGPADLDSPDIVMDKQTEKAAALAGLVPTSLPSSFEPTHPIYGTGATGDVTLNAGSVLLAEGVEYNNLALVGTGAVRCENHILRVKNLLDLTQASALAIRDFTGGGGANAAADVGGGAWGGVGGWTQGNSGTLQAPSGANGGTGAGAQATNATNLQNAFGGKGGGAGAAGAGAGGAGGAARVAATVTNARVTPHWPITFVGPASNATGASAITPPQPIMGGMVGQGGSAGGGDGAAGKGGGGGGAGRGGGSVVVYARGIKVGALTAARAIVAEGQSAGNGANGPGANTGGGSGGGGGGGGLVLIAYDWIIGEQPAGDEVSAAGGTGGSGGNAGAGGAAGAGGDGGDGGQIVFWNLLTGVRSITVGGAGGAGGPPVGANGGAAGTAGACSADFPS